ncbi:ATP-binding cassette domain-containing protein [Oenococcus sicerae]|uniref:ABC transporter ATP-binding protein n=1 Tax=Oenococcus sicerae TaxID=2203724 RepID=UPI0010B376B0|nr:SkfA peptide export ATP-binding protein SkfE [Oenococcus sicerae]
MTYLSLKNISKSYDGKIVFHNQNFDFSQNEIVFFVGKNGVGKTTLMETIVGLNQPDQGTIMLDGRELRIPYDVSARKQLSFLPTENQLVNYLNAKENLAYFAEIYRIKDYEPTISGLIKNYLFADQEKKLVKDYSTGMKRRLSLALIDLIDAPVIILDEPSLGLDIYNTDFLRKQLWAYRQAGKLVIVTSHDLLLCQRLADRVYLFSNDQVVEYQGKAMRNLEQGILDSYDITQSSV